jgi:Ca2+/H+ antiporter
MAGWLALIVVVVGLVALLIVEGWAVYTGRRTISADTQTVSSLADRPGLMGLSFLLGALAMWFIIHFTSPPPGG